MDVFTFSAACNCSFTDQKTLAQLNTKVRNYNGEAKQRVTIYSLYSCMVTHTSNIFSIHGESLMTSYNIYVIFPV